MWEAIRSNQRRSLWLIAVMGSLLVALGIVMGLTVDMVLLFNPLQAVKTGLETGHVATFQEQLWEARGSALIGAGIALLVWGLLYLSAVTSGDSILLSSARAREIRREDAPQLWNIVEEMTIASGLGRMPRIFIIDDASLNAFAAGYDPNRAAVAVTSGLLKSLNRDELQGVLAHEIAHIRNHDVRFMTLAAIMLGTIVMLAHFLLRAMFYGGHGRRGSSRQTGGGAQILMIAVALLFAILAPLLAQILYFATSRRREYLADASAARFTRYPEGLASALEKIQRRPGVAADTNQAVAPMFIINPLQAERSLVRLFSTHPPTAERIRILRSMSGAGFQAYEEAYRAARKSGRCIGAQTLAAESDAVMIRPASVQTAEDTPLSRGEAVERVLDHALPFVVLTCGCGTKLKLPPGWKRPTAECPRCGRQHEVPKAQTAQVLGVAAALGVATAASRAAEAATPAESPARSAANRPARYTRRGRGWESFQCTCGHPVQLSPNFTASTIGCPKCRRRIQIIDAAAEASGT